MNGDYPVIRSRRVLPSGGVEYRIVDEHGNVRNVRLGRNVGAFVDVHELLRHVARRGILTPTQARVLQRRRDRA